MITVRSDKAASVRLGATPIRTTGDGFKVYSGKATFGNVVLRYPDLDPPRSEFVPADEALSPEAVASLLHKPFTIEHPPSLLDGATAREHTVGAVIRAEADLTSDPPALKVDVIVYDAGAQEDIESGRMCELSPGYRCEEEAAPGEHMGQPFQVVQRRRRYNHLSGVSRARTVTPDGRPARLDEQAVGDGSAGSAETPAYPPATRAAEAHQPADRTPTMLVPTDNLPDAPATDGADASTPRTDAKMCDALSPEDAEILKTMSPAGQAAILERLAAGGMTGESSGPVAEAAEVAAGEAAGEMETTTMDKLLSMLTDLSAQVAALKGTTDASAVPPAATPVADKKDSAPALSPAAAEAVIAEARKAAVTAARETVDSSSRIVHAVRADGHHDVVTVADAAKAMLVNVGTYLPMLKPDAEDHLKGGRMDALTRLYKQAEQVRRDSLLESQGRAVMDALGDLAGDPQANAAGDAANYVTPFRAPTPRGA